MNLYNQLQIKGPCAADSAQLADGGVYDLDPASGIIAGKTCPVFRLDGGNHPTGGTVYFGGDPADVSENDPASVVLYALKIFRAGSATRCVAHALNSAATVTFGTGTLALGVSDLLDTVLWADDVGTWTAAGYGAQLADAYAAFTPRPHSPGSNGIGALLLPSLPAMHALAVDIYGGSAHDRYVMMDSHS